MPFCIMRTLSTFSCEYFCSFTEVKIRVCLLCSIWVLQVFPPPVTLCVTAPSSVRQSESQPNTNTILYLWYTHDSRFDLRLTGDLFCFIFMASNQLFWRRVEFWVLSFESCFERGLVGPVSDLSKSSRGREAATEKVLLSQVRLLVLRGGDRRLWTVWGWSRSLREEGFAYGAVCGQRAGGRGWCGQADGQQSSGLEVQSSAFILMGRQSSPPSDVFSSLISSDPPLCEVIVPGCSRSDLWPLLEVMGWSSVEAVWRLVRSADPAGSEQRHGTAATCCGRQEFNEDQDLVQVPQSVWLCWCVDLQSDSKTWTFNLF